MTDKYGVPIPIPPLSVIGSFPEQVGVSDPLLGYVADFLKTIMVAYAGDAWDSVQPGKPLVRTIRIGEPEDGFVESWLPALYIYRSPRETRELVETFEDIADDYRFEKSRLSVQWICDPQPQEIRRIRGEIVNGLRKVIDRSIARGRDPAWIVPGDTDLQAPTFGSSLSNYGGYATLELLHAAPGKYIHKMLPPAPPKKYDELRMSLYVEELLERDLSLIGDPHNEIQIEYKIKDQGTGLGELIIGDSVLPSTE